MKNITENQITVVDLDLLRNIVDVATSRGAFRGAELTQVGEVYDKLTKFLEAVVAQAKAQEAAGGEVPTVPETPKGE
jgi:hypothetical protein